MGILVNGPILAILGAFFYAAHLIIVRKATVTSEPLDAALAVTLVNALLFLPLILVYLSDFGFPLVALLAFVASGVFANFLGRICVYEGTKRIGASRTIPFTRGETLVATFLGIMVLGEAITIGHLTGTFVLVGGVMVLSYEVKEEEAGGGWGVSPDLMFPFMAMILFGFAALFDKTGLSQGVPIPVGLAVKFSGAVLGLSLYSIIKGNSIFTQLTEGNKKMLFSAGLTSSIGLGFLYMAFSVSDIVDVMPFWSMSPLFGVLLSFIFLKDLEKITKPVIIGSILVVIGAVLIERFMV